MIKAIFFDVANTLLEKPDLMNGIQESLETFDHHFDKATIALKHKKLSENTLFPDKTTKEFYDSFNKKLILTLGVKANPNLVREIYQRSIGLNWRPYPDLNIVYDLKLPLGIGSNWDLSLSDKLQTYFGSRFNWILGSEELGVKKPHPDFFEKMIEISGYSATELLFVGDSMRLDILPAQVAGINTLLIDRINFYADYQGAKINSMDQIVDFI